MPFVQQFLMDFYPRPPRGGRHLKEVSTISRRKFLSTPSARRATSIIDARAVSETISIHALREEGDGGQASCPSWHRDFYPRPPRGGRLIWWIYDAARVVFLSTPSARRATVTQAIRGQWPTYFYPRPPRGGRQKNKDSFISVKPDFYPRPPRGGRPFYRAYSPFEVKISIHALREEGDLRHFDAHNAPAGFLSTPSARRATHGEGYLRQPGRISIHALREEGDLPLSEGMAKPMYFYPRPPRGGRRFRGCQNRLPLSLIHI